MKKTRGLRFERFDLHVHTPASPDFEGSGVTAGDIVAQALARGLRGIAITDHCTGAYVDEAKKAAKGKALVVFPGVEVGCSGGKAGIHVIALLPEDRSQKHVNALLSDLKIVPDDFGKLGTVSPKSVAEAIQIISSREHKGIAVLAHCTSSKGVLHDLSGEVRKLTFKQPGLLAVETSENDFTSEEKMAKGKRAIDLLSGADSNYCNRKLGVYIASDSREKPDSPAHSLQGVGSRWTYFKVDEHPTLESLRQCFIDPETRIRQGFELQAEDPPRVVKMSIEGGFFDGEIAVFHEGLNSILGAKGAGKSLLVELLRFVLCQPPEHPRILEDHNRKLEARLQTYGRVTLEFIDRTGELVTIQRTLDPENGNPYTDHGQEVAAEAFQAIILSQNEIISIAEEENLQIGFIDRFFDFRNYKDRIRIIQDDLAGLDARFAEALRAVHETRDSAKEISECEHKLAQVGKLLKDPTYESYKMSEAKNRSIGEHVEAVEEMRGFIGEQLSELREFKPPEIPEEVDSDPALLRSRQSILKLLEHLKQQLVTAGDSVDTAAGSIEKELKKWEPQYEQALRQYQDYVREAGGDRKELEKQRQQLVKRRKDLLERKKRLDERRRELSQLSDERNAQIDRLLEIYREYTAERKSKCDRFAKESGNRLQVTLQEGGNKQEFKAALLAMKRGTYLRDAEVAQLCDRVSPRDFVMEILRYYYELTLSNKSKAEERLSALAKMADLESETLKALADFLLAQVPYEELLALQYRVHPEDRPEIQLEISDGNYEHIRDVSVGQKCTAMVIMALSDGAYPIVIDQPEDSLDVRSVWQDMCSRLRGEKNARQFILTTHNSCLAVASDTDKYMVIEGEKDQGTIVASGALETEAVRREVIDYLEGGEDTYNTKAAKYGMNRPDLI